MKAFFVILFSIFIATAFAQSDSPFVLRKRIPVQAADITVDNLNNIYLITANDQLKKFYPSGDSAAVFNDVRRFGKLYSVDVTNPLKLLLFYKDFATVVLLDRFLSPKNIVDLRQQNILQASAAAIAYDNNIWVFDAVENKLKKINEGGNLLLQTPDFRTLFAENFIPQKIIDYNNSVYLFDPVRGILQFDYFGTLQKKLPLQNWRTIAIGDKLLMGTDSTGLVLYNPQNFMQRQYQFPSSFGSFNRYVVANTQLFALSKDSLSVYSLPK